MKGETLMMIGCAALGAGALALNLWVLFARLRKRTERKNRERDERAISSAQLYAPRRKPPNAAKATTTSRIDFKLILRIVPQRPARAERERGLI